MLILKIRWTSRENSELKDETDVFVLANKVMAHGWIKSDDEMNQWPEGSYFDYRHVVQETETNQAMTNKLNGRILQVENGDKTLWYLATSAWLLGPDGKTIENLTPS